MRRPIVVFPHPDSPTSPNVSPSRRVNETSETACTLPTLCWITAPEVNGNSFTRWSISRIGLPVGQLDDPDLGALEGAHPLGVAQCQHGAPLVALAADRVEAGEDVIGAADRRGERRLLLAANLGGVRAARIEAAVRQLLAQVGRRPGML